MLAHLNFPKIFQSLTKPFESHELDGVGVVVVHHQCRVEGLKRRLQNSRYKRHGDFLNVKPRQADETSDEGDNDGNDEGNNAADDA